ncbi:MAG: hypothetical protein IPO75_00815 [Betaproteobacteria bacterium]|nr:hypothetical protein [Betaproteobacteria bacterium]
MRTLTADQVAICAPRDTAPRVPARSRRTSPAVTVEFVVLASHGPVVSGIVAGGRPRRDRGTGVHRQLAAAAIGRCAR